MLTIQVSGGELFNEKTGEFVSCPPVTLQMEHSLVSLSKWESKHKKHFLGNKTITNDEAVDYIRCMTITKNVDPGIYNFLSEENLKEIREYLDDPMTATTVKRKEGSAPSREIVTSELIYYWMISYNIPMECQKWHLNRLLMLIQVCGVKNAPGKTMKGKELMRANSALNAARRSRSHSRG